MNSVNVHLCGIVLAAFVVHASCRHDCKCSGAVKTAPFNFSYVNWKDHELNVRVNLENLSADVNYKMYKARIYGTGAQQTKMNTKSMRTNRIKQLINFTKREYQKDICIEIKKKENNYTRINMISIYLALETKAGCRKNITILEGIASTYNQVIPGYKRNEECLGCPPCTIVLNLTNECIGSSTKTSDTPATTPTAGDTSTASGKPSTIPVLVPDQNYFTKNATTSGSDVTSTPHMYIETTTRNMTGNDDKRTDKQSQSSQDVLIFVISSVIVMAVAILVMYISLKKYRHGNSDPVDTIELNTYATANDVVYADLSLVHGDSQPPKREEDSTYAQIIGVISPVYENLKNK